MQTKKEQILSPYCKWPTQSANNQLCALAFKNISPIENSIHHVIIINAFQPLLFF